MLTLARHAPHTSVRWLRIPHHFNSLAKFSPLKAMPQPNDLLDLAEVLVVRRRLYPSHVKVVLNICVVNFLSFIKSITGRLAQLVRAWC
jgi:hypothetical protein